ncbi:hypothetical protein X975_11618, partial [Stegodyphus mimosarum]
MMSEPVSVEQRIIIKFLVCENVKPDEIYHRLLAQLEEASLSWSRVKVWCNEFKQVRECVANQAHPRRLRTSVTNENIAHVRELIERDRRFTELQISEELAVNYGSVQSIIRKQLGFRKISVCWVPRLLNDDQKSARVRISQLLRTHFEEEGEAFLHKIVTCDETWVRHYTPESKCASMQGRKKGEENSVKAKTRLSAGKVLAKVFWD